MKLVLCQEKVNDIQLNIINNDFLDRTKIESFIENVNLKKIFIKEQCDLHFFSELKVLCRIFCCKYLAGPGVFQRL